MNRLRVNHFGNAAYKVSDLQKAKQFYSEGFQLTPYFDEPTWVIFEVLRYHLWLIPNDSTEDISRIYGLDLLRHSLFGWIVKDVHAVYKRFIDLGAVGLKPPERNGPFTEAILQDPWGNKWGLASGPF